MTELDAKVAVRLKILEDRLTRKDAIVGKIKATPNTIIIYVDSSAANACWMSGL